MKLTNIFKINIIKTLYFNFKYFPLNIAIHFPVFIYKRTVFYKLKGKIILQSSPKLGLLRIGPHGLGTQNIKYARTICDINGTIIINGKANIGRGSHISVGKNATLTLGERFSITGNSTIICQKQITFGNNCLLSWEILIMDTDFHHIINNNNEIVNPPLPINIGNNVWIGCKNTILKGVSIANNTVIAANSTLTKSINKNNCIIGGNGKILKQDISWLP